MKIVVTGKNGQLGNAVIKECLKRGHDVTGTDRAHMDITIPEQVRETLCRIQPDIVIHCASYTDVEKAEDEKEVCTAVNVYGTENIADYCKEAAIKLIYVSTDYVFGGTGTHFLKTDEPYRPLNVYGWSKCRGEELVREKVDCHFIVRTSWLFGEDGSNFVDTMLKLSEARAEIKVVNDQTGSPTYTADLAKMLCDMAETVKYGTYHVTNEGTCTWYEFAEQIFQKIRKQTILLPVSSGEFQKKASRPKNSRLDKSKLTKAGFELLPDWKDALERYLKNKQRQKGDDYDKR